MTVVGRLAAVPVKLWRDARATAFVEFGLMFPMFLGFVVAGIEFSNLMLANMRVQRLATITADMIAQRGASDKQISELQIYDILDAVKLTAKPLDFSGRGRVIISAVLGEDTGTDRIADTNRIKWQRFDGGYVGATRKMGCRTSNDVAVLANNRQLVLNEALFHVQVSYRYEPFFLGSLVDAFSVPTVINRYAAFRGRGSVFKDVLASPGYNAKTNCTSATGL